MNIYFLSSKDLIDDESEIHYGFHSTLRNEKFPHYHDFFELFLVLKGNVSTIVLGVENIYKEGSLVFIRPNEIHTKKFIGSCQYINVSFPCKTINDLFNYLGDGFSKDLLLSPKYPPSVVLSKVERNIVRKKFENLHTIPASDKKLIKMELRILLIELFTRYFSLHYHSQDSTVPAWLVTVLDEMKKKENFTKGMEALIELSGKSHAYLCRIIKKHTNMTPVEYINDLKLNYALNLLSHTDYDILHISLESGFENLSHFNHEFKKKYGIAPSKLRKKR